MPRRILGEGPHEAALVIGVLKAVEKHVIEHATMAEAVACAGAVEQIGGVAHALHAAGDHDPGATRRDQVMGQHDRLHAGAADLADGGAGDRLGQPRPQRRLTGGRLAEARWQHIAHEGLIHRLPRDPRAGEGACDGLGAKLRRGDARKGALESAHGRADGGGDDDGVAEHG